MIHLYQTRFVDNTTWYENVVNTLNTTKRAIWIQPIKEISKYEHELQLKDYPNISIKITFHGDISESLILALDMKKAAKLTFIDLIKILSIRDVLRDVTLAKTILYKEALAQ